MSFEPRTRLQKILMGVTATPRTAIEHAVKYAVDHSGGGSDLPDVTSADNGDVLGVVSGEWSKTTPKSYAPFETVGTFVTSEEKDTITLNKTASELYAAISGGFLCKITATFVVQETTVTSTAIVNISSSRLTGGESVQYSFSFVSADGVIFKTADLTADDAVVFVEV